MFCKVDYYLSCQKEVLDAKLMAWPPNLQDINTIKDMRSNFKRDVNEYGKQYPRKRS